MRRAAPGRLGPRSRVGSACRTGSGTRPAALSSAERERVRLYPYFTQRILGRVPGLAEVGAIAGSHREHLDGSGFPKGVDAIVPVRPGPHPGRGGDGCSR